MVSLPAVTLFWNPSHISSRSFSDLSRKNHIYRKPLHGFPVDKGLAQFPLQGGGVVAVAFHAYRDFTGIEVLAEGQDKRFILGFDFVEP